jgi:hypothetical protein
LFGSVIIKAIHQVLRSRSGNFATFAAMRLASSPREQLGRRSAAGLLLEIDKCELLARLVFDDKAGFQFVDGPGRREPGSVTPPFHANE